MTCRMLRDRRAKVAASLVPLLLAAAAATGCDLLDVSDPTAILEDDVNDGFGAELLRRGALRQLFFAVGNGAWESGLVADEFRYDAAFPSGDDALDRRATAEYQEVYGSFVYSLWQSLRAKETAIALAKLRTYAPPGAGEAHVGEMFAVRGYATLRLGQDFCSGFPLHEMVDYQTVYGPPLSTEEVFERALADFDSALGWAADSVRVLNFARIGQARTLLNLGRYAEAAAAVSLVPTDYLYAAQYGMDDPTNPLTSEPEWYQWGPERSVADLEGGNGLDFVSANDPRVQTILRGTAQDGVTGMYAIAKYPSRTTPIVLASGVEARLIEAEAALQAGDAGTWLSQLNQLRQTVALPDTTDPGTDAARVNLTFRERAFWLFATGHRLGDLRRLVRQYGRSSESVFPTGVYWRGGVYGTGTNVPFSRDEATLSPGVTGCTSW